MPTLSIIVPIYNVERYLPRCIDSILTQTFCDFELILVDDGATDNSGLICDEYLCKDSRIKVIHQENYGVSAARNKGISIAVGQYIAYVDADDWIEPQMYNNMILEAKKSGADIVVCGCNYMSEAEILRRADLLFEGSFGSETALATLYGMPNLLGGSACNKLFLKSTVEKVRFRKNVKMAEDWLYLFDCYCESKNIIKIPWPLYNVVERRGSATRNDNVDAIYETLVSSKWLLMLLARKRSIELEKKAVDKYLDDCLRYLPEMEEIGQRTGQPYRMKLLHIKWLMLKVIVRAYIYKLLPKAKIHGYIMGMIKL